ncbi:MAG: GNAT family N-acetyltransferase [Roseiarcus sp.]|jgi:GNAT superfamily N-acetyltransferase
MLSAPEPIAAHHETEAFSCGKPALDAWLKTRALANQRNGFAVVMVSHEANRVVGYYAVAPTAILPASMPRSLRTGQPPNPVPCLLLGQLAIDRQWAGRGLGTALLAHALRRSVRAAELVGGRALVVKAIDDEAAAFWRRCGFRPSRDDDKLLFRSMSDIAAALREAGAD